MEFLISWIKMAACFLIIISLFKNILPSEKYEKFLDTFLGLLLIYSLISPLKDFSEINELLNLDNLLSEDIAINTAIKSRSDEYLGKFATSVIEKEICAQIKACASDAGLNVDEVTVLCDNGSDGFLPEEINKITVFCKTAPDPVCCKKFSAELSKYLNISENDIFIDAGES